MTRDEMIRILGEWIGEITEQPPPKLSSGTDLIKDLCLDSLALAELAARLRMRYQVKIRTVEFGKGLQVGAIVDLVREQMKAQKP